MNTEPVMVTHPDPFLLWLLEAVLTYALITECVGGAILLHRSLR